MSTPTPPADRPEALPARLFRFLRALTAEVAPGPAGRRTTAVALAAAAAAGLAWYAALGAAHTLNPLRIDWMITGDWSQHLLGWLFYRNEPWLALPLGKIAGWLFPVGTRVGFSDSIPWLAVLLRPLSALLPQDFQYIGPWLGACFAAQGVTGALLVREASPRPLHWILGGALFVLTPTLLLRIGHPSLCAHGFLVALLWLSFKAMPSPRAVRRAVVLAFALNVACAGVHPYLEVMVAALSVALFARLAWEGHLRPWVFPALTGALAAVVAGVLALFGYVDPAQTIGAGGFGTYSADALTLFNPMGWSRVLPPLRTGPGGYEGLGYLGLGAIAGLVAAAGSAVVRWPRVRTLPLGRAVPVAVACAALAVASFLPRIQVNNETWLDLSGAFTQVQTLVQAFRSNGRFIWPVHYLAFAAATGLLALLWADRPRVVTALLTGVLLIQLLEVTPQPARYRWNIPTFDRPSSPGWALTQGRYRHLVMFPTEILNLACGPRPMYRDAVVVRLAYQAYRLGMTFNSGYLARVDRAAAGACHTLLSQVAQGMLHPDVLYVVWPEHRPYFQRVGATCGTLDGHLVCARPSAPDAFTRFLSGSEVSG